MPDTAKDVEEVILGVCTPRWQKVAMVLAKAADECKASSLTSEWDEIWVSLASLVDGGRLEALGDISNWRFSEVRLPEKEKAQAAEEVP